MSSLSNSNFDLIFADDDAPTSTSASASASRLSSLQLQQDTAHHHHASDSSSGSECFHIIRNILSLLNGVNAETVKKTPNDIFMLLKYGSPDGQQSSHPQHSSNPNFVFHCELSDQFCQLIIRIGSLGKLLLKILNYLNYYTLNRASSVESSRHPRTYPMFDEAYGKSTLGNIKQYFVNSAHQEIKLYHYHLLLIESKFRVLGSAGGRHSQQQAGNPNPNANVHYALRRILLWTDEWLAKFLFLSDLLKACLDLKGVSLLNAVHDHSQHGDPMIRQLARGVLHQTLKPFIGNVFDWLLTGEVALDIGGDFFIRKPEKETLLDVVPPKLTEMTSDNSNEKQRRRSSNADSEPFEWRVYQLNDCQLPTFLSKLVLRKIFLIGNAVRLLRYMLKEEYDAKYASQLFGHSPIMASYNCLKRFVYKQLDSYGGSGGSNESSAGETTGVHHQQPNQQHSNLPEPAFFFEHPLVDEFDLLLNAYYEVLNEEVFKLLAMGQLAAQFETQLGYVLMQRGDFYESLIDYLLPLLRKPASEVVNIVSTPSNAGYSSSSSNNSSLAQIFNMFLVNAKLIELAAVYRIDSLLCDQTDESLVFSFAARPPPLKHHLGWDIFTTRYRFTKNVYAVLFEASSVRYERLFRALFQFRRVLVGIRTTQRQVSFYLRRISLSGCGSKLGKPVLQLLRLLHYLLFHQFGLVSRVYQHFGSQIASHWSSVFAPQLVAPSGSTAGSRKPALIGSIEKLVRAHERFLSSIEAIVFFGGAHSMIAAFGAVNDSVVDFCEAFAETELFPTLEAMLKNSEAEDFEELQTIAEALFRHQFKVSITISKYRCTVGNFISLATEAGLEFKYDILNYGPCLDHLFSCHTRRTKAGDDIF